VTCWHCGNALAALEYGRQDICPKCRRDTKVCRNCHFHDRSANNECREPQAERVVDKERSNFCDYFKPRAGGGSTEKSALSASEAAKAAAEALFRKK
jgi:hypothetical protein